MSDAEMLTQALADVKLNTDAGLALQVRMYHMLAEIALNELDRRGLCLHFPDLQPVPKVPDYGRIMREKGKATS